MKKTLLSIGACLALFAGSAQTQIFFEDFEGGAGGFTLNTTDQSSTATGFNDWVVNNSYAGGAGDVFCLFTIPYTIAATDPQPVGISNQNGNYVHILADEMAVDGITNNAFFPADGFCNFPENYFFRMTNDVNTSVFTGVSINFWWLCSGGVDNFAELYYSTDGGTTWTQDMTLAKYNTQATWTQQNITNAAWDGQTQLRFGVKWLNPAPTDTPTDPGFGMDDFEITGTAPPCSDNASNFSVTSCFSYTVPSGDETYNTTGTQTVMDTILNVAGCDSVMTISLTINDVDTSAVNNNNGTATAQSGTGTFQWLDCDNAMAAVTGATTALFAPATAGNYAVEVTDNGCVDTSSCINIQGASITELETNEFKIYPNPTNGEFSIDLTGLIGNQIISILDAKGAIIMNKTVASGSVIEYDLNLESGVYFVRLIDQYGMIRRSRLMVE
jgi:Secretion system C-terminal sorting domain